MAGILLTCGATGCGKQKEKEKYVEYSFDFFDTVAAITGYEDSKEKFDDNIKLIENEFLKCHRLYNIYYTYEGVTNLKTMNSLKDGEHRKLKVDPLLYEMLDFSKSIYTLTGGKTNPAMGSVLSIWHEAREHAEYNPGDAYVPDLEKLKEAALHTDFGSIVFDSNELTVYITDPKQTIDAGAVAKGYAIQHVADFMKEKGITGYCLNIGGNVCPVGEKGNGNGKWAVGIENPLFNRDTDPSEDAFIAVLELSDKAVATSGSYQRYYTVDGVNYHHIINPDTLMPENLWLSVSVISDDAGLCDGLSTALFNMTIEEGKELIDSLPGVEAIWMAPDKTVTMSDGVEQYLRK